MIASPAPDVLVAEPGGSSVNLLLRVWVDRPELERLVFRRTLDAAKLAIDEAANEIPFPHLQLFVEDVEKRALQKVADFARPFMRSTPAADGVRVPRRPSGEW